MRLARPRGREADRKYIMKASNWLADRLWEDSSSASSTIKPAVFRSYPGEPQFEEWDRHYIATGNTAMVRELKSRRESGQGYDFESEWPPRPEPKLAVVGSAS